MWIIGFSALVQRSPKLAYVLVPKKGERECKEESLAHTKLAFNSQFLLPERRAEWLTVTFTFDSPMFVTEEFGTLASQDLAVGERVQGDVGRRCWFVSWLIFPQFKSFFFASILQTPYFSGWSIGLGTHTCCGDVGYTTKLIVPCCCCFANPHLSLAHAMPALRADGPQNVCCLSKGPRGRPIHRRGLQVPSSSHGV